MTNPLQTIPNLPVSTALAGTEELWINQSGTDRRTTTGAIGALTPQGPIGPQGNPGGNIMAIGLFSAASGLTISTGTNIVQTSGFRARGQGIARYINDTLVDSTFVATYPNVGFISANGRGFRLDHTQDLELYMFGAYGDGTTDDLPAFAAANDYFIWLAVNGKLGYRDGFPGTYRPFPKLYVLIGNFYLSAPFSVTNGTWDIEGANLGAQNGGFSSAITVAAGNDGFVFQSYNTTGVNTSKTTRADGYGAMGSRIANIRFISLGAGSNSTACGIYSRTFITVENCGAQIFPDDGLVFAATAGGGGSSEGNANNATVIGGYYAFNGKNGIHCIGADANNISIYNPNCVSSAGWGILDDSFLGIEVFGAHTSGNGTFGAGLAPGLTRGAICSDGTYRYVLVNGQDSNATTTAPTAGANNSVWLYFSAGADSFFWPLWTTGHTWQSGGCYCSSNANSSTVFTSCYAEGDNAPAQLGRAVWRGGTPGPGAYGAYVGGVGATGTTSQSVGLQAYRNAFDQAGVYGETISQIGEGGSNGITHFISDTRYDPNGFQWYFNYFTKNWHLEHVFPVVGVSQLTTTASTYAFGRVVPQPYKQLFTELFLGDNNNARNITFAATIPVSGVYAQGDWVLYNAPTAGAAPGAVCTTGGAIATANWASTHAYAVGAIVLNDSAKTYVCTTAGTSAGSGGPTGTGTGITDGTVVWNYVASFVFKAMANLAA